MLTFENNQTRLTTWFLRITLLVLLLLVFNGPAVANDEFETIGVNDWGSGFNATFEYVIKESDVVADKVRDWRIEIDYAGQAQIGNGYMQGYAGTVRVGNIVDTSDYAITNEGVGYRLELGASEKLRFTLQGQGAGFSLSDFTFRFVNLTAAPTNNFESSLVSVNDWYNPQWGGGFNATFRCDVLGPDAYIGPVTDLLIEWSNRVRLHRHRRKLRHQ